MATATARLHIPVTPNKRRQLERILTANSGDFHDHMNDSPQTRVRLPPHGILVESVMVGFEQHSPKQMHNAVQDESGVNWCLLCADVCNSNALLIQENKDGNQASNGKKELADLTSSNKKRKKTTPKKLQLGDFASNASQTSPNTYHSLEQHQSSQSEQGSSIKTVSTAVQRSTSVLRQDAVVEKHDMQPCMTATSDLYSPTQSHAYNTTEDVANDSQSVAASTKKKHTLLGYLVPKNGVSTSEFENLQIRENALAKREQLLEDKLRELELLRAQREQDQQTISALHNDLTQLQNEHAEYQARVRQLLAEVMVESAQLRQRETEEQLIRDKFKIGQVVPQREGHLVHDVWEDGEAFRELRRKTDQKMREKDLLEASKKKLSKDVRANSKKENSSSGISCQNEEQFRKPRNRTADEMESGELIAVSLKKVTCDLADLKEDERRLDTQKKTLIRKQKLLSDQHTSRFNNHPTLGTRYVLLDMLGKGGFSEVYKAFDLWDLRYVAVKIHHLNAGWNEEKKQNYQRHATREYHIHRTLHHPRIVRLHNVFSIDMSTFATVLDYCNGPDLDLYIKQRSMLAEREARAIIMQVFSGLKYLNEQKQRIIHYDLKPGNILFDNNEVKITDFGLSKIVDDTAADGIELTSQGAGTYWYLPPECFSMDRSRKPLITSAVDVWSAGVILYQMLLGRKPFGHGLNPETLLSQGTMSRVKEVEFPEKPGLSEVTRTFICKCLAHSPADRPDIMTIFDEPFFRATFR